VAQTAENTGEVTGSDLGEIKLGKTVSEGLESASRFLGGYDTVLVVSPSAEEYDTGSDTAEEDDLSSVTVEYDEELVPSMAHYKNGKDTVSDINGGEGDVLIVGLGLDMKMPYINERNLDEYEFEGNWWDNLEEVEADVLLDRDSYEGAVHIPRGAETENVSREDYSENLYHLTWD
jgi:hypothetical protein